MKQTLRLCNWFILGLGAAMTVFMNLRAMDSVLHPGIFLPVALLPYLVLALALRRTGRQSVLAVILAGALLTLAVGFRWYHDGLFVRLTTLNATLFIETPLFQMVPASAAWLVSRLFRPKQVIVGSQMADQCHEP